MKVGNNVIPAVLTKQAFVTSLNCMRDAVDYCDYLYNTMHISLTDDNILHEILANYLGIIEEMLILSGKVFEDDEGGNVLEYFCYDLDFGRNKMAENCITETREDGAFGSYSLRSAEELWDYICKEN